MMNLRANRIFSTLFLFLSFYGLKGQVNEGLKDSTSTSSLYHPYYKRAYIGIAYGFAIPTGSFGTESSVQSKAFALRGSSLNGIYFGYRLKSSFYASAAYFSSNNSVDEKELSRSLAKENNKLYTTDATNYSLRSFLLGVGLTKSTESLDIDLRFYGGLGTISTPSFTISETEFNTNQNTVYEIPTESQSGFGGGLSLALRVHLNEQIDFYSKGTFLLFRNEFQDLTPNSSQKTSLNYEVLMLNFGLAFRFIPDKKH